MRAAVARMAACGAPTVPTERVIDLLARERRERERERERERGRERQQGKIEYTLHYMWTRCCTLLVENTILHAS